MKAYSIDLRTKIVNSVRRGVSKSETARRFGVNRSTVGRYLKRLDEEGSLIPRKAPGAPPKLDESAMRLVEKTSRPVDGLPINRGARFSLPAQHLYEIRNTGLLYLFQRSEVRRCGVQRWDFLYPAAWASDSLAKHSSGLVRP